MTTYTCTRDQAANLVSKWNELANDGAQLEPRQAHLLLGDNADMDLETNGQHLVEVPASQSRTGQTQSFYVYEANLTAES